MRKLLVAVLVLLVVGNCLLIAGAGLLLTNRFSKPQVRASQTAFEPSIPSPSARGTQPQSRPVTVPTALATAASNQNAPAAPTTQPLTTLDKLEQAQMPPYDRMLLAREFQGAGTTFATPTAPRQYKIGDKETFWVNRDLQNENVQVSATLRYMNDVVYMWVEDGVQVNDADLKRSADYFANTIYPTNRKYLGSEPNPGIDNDPRLHILNTRFNALGYFWPLDLLPPDVAKHSNQHEMFYVNTQMMLPGTQLYDSTLAHEFAHMIHHNQNQRGDAAWITEGFGDLGIELNGFDTGHVPAFAQDPDLQLNAWGSLPNMSVPHYGAAYLFMSYLLNRFGDEFVRDVFSSNRNGIPSVEYALAKHAPDLSFDQVFADWVAANFVQSAAFGPHYAYGKGELQLQPTVSLDRYPAQGSDTVHQYGTDYIQLVPNGGDVTFHFDGSDTVRAVPTDPYSGKMMWWSGRTDSSDSRITREFDLSGVNRATLKFWTWYSIEDDFDYGYVSVSTDGGNTWKTLPGTTTTNRDPNATNLGNGLTCESGVGCGKPDEAPQWIQETFDLSPYAGQKILLRIEQVTDPVYAAPGLAVDDIEIPEIGFRDDAETSDNGWVAEGFARIDNILPQRFIVQAIEYGAEPKVVPIPLDSANRGSFTTTNFGKGVNRIVIAISGSTPITWEQANYQYQVQ